MTEDIKYGGQHSCGTQIIKIGDGAWHCPKCEPDILERAKAIVAEYTAHNRSVGLLPDLIAEVERLRSENRELKKTDTWANDVIKWHESLRGEIFAKDARIKELEAALEDVGDCQSIAYMLGGKKKAEENKILIDYIKRLEAAFLKAETLARSYTKVYPDAKLGGTVWYWAKTDAREELERIKEGGKDER